ncbi:MAG TPA: 3-hydroxyacyl-[acyl-carrier-protein] dehydratase FabZ [Bdellovibrionales bacterium]|nr:3-hydroxyacyl-[acyl-carrier-protein] dehydratase FabZ [Pseudobdellovibrionaceae bacterium]HAG90394.1 3-hydroxyacyl-[acyl-carrier-protein] dehydratase FabZ [Bdellovibrionales bacterium]|tara:strand:- start:3495 stop:3971 length:477 start_codon:yes stop_codon:yes gene_type:complete
MEKVLTNKEVQEILPHRYPFLLVDCVLELKDSEQPDSKVGRSAVVIKNVTANEPFFQGHFPGFPIMPGVLLVEAMAQAAALAYYRDGEPKLNFMIAGVEKAKFRRPVTPGDQLEMHARILKDRKNMIQAECFVRVAGKVTTEATILAAISAREGEGSF